MFKGMIIFWYGTLVMIPHGWHLCDGNAGTPNLLKYFIVGAGGAYNVGDEAHVFIHSHIAQAPHLHSLGAGTDIELGVGKNWQTNSTNPLITSDHIDHHPPFYALLPIIKQ